MRLLPKHLSGLAPGRAKTGVFRALSTSALNVAALDAWIRSNKQLVHTSLLSGDHLADLYVTLPSRSGAVDAASPTISPPESGTALGYGHHLAFFHARNPESALRADGTDTDFCPPEPFTRRMWAGGSMRWTQSKPLLVGRRASVQTEVTSIEKKGFAAEGRTPMVFVRQGLQVFMEGETEASVVEERTHVYLPPKAEKRTTRIVDGLPSPDFSFAWTPSPTTLFRFSALTFNGHYIHLDRDYAQQEEGYPERLVHGPLTALMLLETIMLQKPTAQLDWFEYRAINPVVVNRRMTIHGSWEDNTKAQMWTVDDDGTVGMVGKITISEK